MRTAPAIAATLLLLQVRYKVLGAVSALVRDFPPAYDELLKADPLRLIKPMLAQPNARLTSKALFFLQYLVSTSSERCDVDMQESIVACASSDDFVVREMALRVLLRLCETQPPAPPTLSAAIARRLAVLKDLKGEEAETLADELELCKEIAKNFSRRVDSKALNHRSVP